MPTTTPLLSTRTRLIPFSLIRDTISLSGASSATVITLGLMISGQLDRGRGHIHWRACRGSAGTRASAAPRLRAELSTPEEVSFGKDAAERARTVDDRQPADPDLISRDSAASVNRASGEIETMRRVIMSRASILHCPAQRLFPDDGMTKKRDFNLFGGAGNRLARQRRINPRRLDQPQVGRYRIAGMQQHNVAGPISPARTRPTPFEHCNDGATFLQLAEIQSQCKYGMVASSDWLSSSVERGMASVFNEINRLIFQPDNARIEAGVCSGRNADDRSTFHLIGKDGSDQFATRLSKLSRASSLITQAGFRSACGRRLAAAVPRWSIHDPNARRGQALQPDDEDRLCSRLVRNRSELTRFPVESGSG